MFSTRFITLWEFLLCVSLLLAGLLSCSVLASQAHLRFSSASGGIPVTHWKAMRDKEVEKQDEDFSCGSAAAATILRYFYGESVTEKDVLDLVIKAGDDGTASFSDLSKAATELGYKGIGLSVSFEKLQQLKIPALVYLKYRDKDHFSVVRGISNEGLVRLGDPSWGNRTFSSDQFNAMWQTPADTNSGKILLFVPQKKIRLNSIKTFLHHRYAT